jgi:hypothetical protein
MGSRRKWVAQLAREKRKTVHQFVGTARTWRKQLGKERSKPTWRPCEPKRRQSCRRQSSSCQPLSTLISLVLAVVVPRHQHHPVLHTDQRRPALDGALPRDAEIIGPCQSRPALSLSVSLLSFSPPSPPSRPRFPSFNCSFSRRRRLSTDFLSILQNITRQSKQQRTW